MLYFFNYIYFFINRETMNHNHNIHIERRPLLSTKNLYRIGTFAFHLFQANYAAAKTWMRTENAVPFIVSKLSLENYSFQGLRKDSKLIAKGWHKDVENKSSKSFCYSFAICLLSLLEIIQGKFQGAQNYVRRQGL